MRQSSHVMHDYIGTLFFLFILIFKLSYRALLLRLWLVVKLFPLPFHAITHTTPRPLKQNTRDTGLSACTMYPHGIVTRPQDPMPFFFYATVQL